MRQIIAAVVVLAASAAAAADAQPAKSQDDLERGRELHDARCLGCHGHEAYRAGRRQATTLSQLEAEVKRWNGPVSPPLSRAELALVTRYLNASYYHF